MRKTSTTLPNILHLPLCNIKSIKKTNSSQDTDKIKKILKNIDHCK